MILSRKKTKKRIWILFATGISVFILLCVGIYLLVINFAPSGDKADDALAKKILESYVTPKFKTQTIISGRSHVWDVKFLPPGELIFTERGGTVNILKNNKAQEVTTIGDVNSKGEGGLMGLAVDPTFKENRFVYLCFNSTKGNRDVRIVRFVLSTDLKLKNRQDIVTGIPANESGRHSGCRLDFGPDGYLWIGTGDAAQSSNPQDPKSLGGKILRIDRAGGGAPGNIGGDFDPRIFSYGHRNTQGLAFLPKEREGVLGFSAEHGSYTDDELNLLKKGNFGWAPSGDGYSEFNVPMTDTKKFPDAITALWRSGTPTQAPSGIAYIKGDKWLGWNDSIAMAMLKTRHLKIIKLTNNNKYVKEEKVLINEFGRLRSVTQGPDGNIYIGTTNGKDDKIIKLSPIKS